MNGYDRDGHGLYDCGDRDEYHVRNCAHVRVYDRENDRDGVYGRERVLEHEHARSRVHGFPAWSIRYSDLTVVSPTYLTFL